MFTKAQIREIASKICWWGKKDSNLSTVSATAEDTLVVVKDGENKNLALSDYQAYNADSFTGTCSVDLDIIRPTGSISHTYVNGGRDNPEDSIGVTAFYGKVTQIASYAEGGARRYYTFVSGNGDFNSSINLYPTVTFAIKTASEEEEQGITELGTRVYIDDVEVGQTHGWESDYYEYLVVPNVTPGNHTFHLFTESYLYDRHAYGEFVANQDTIVRVSMLDDGEGRDS